MSDHYVSAFGVDHGYEQIEKIGFGGLGQGIGRVAFQGAKRAGQMAGKFKPAAGAAGLKRAGQTAGFQGLKTAGQGMKKVGNFASARPGLTGGLAAGGAAAGVGGAGAAFGNRRRF